MRTTRTLRRLMAVALSAGALVALPAAANAAVDLSVTLGTPITDPAEAGGATTLTVTLSNDGADPADAGTIQVSGRGTTGYGDFVLPYEGVPRGLVFGTFSQPDTDGNGALVDVSSGEIFIAPGFDNSEDVVVTIPVTLPTEYTTGFSFDGMADGTWAGTNIVSSNPVTVTKGGPSDVRVQAGVIAPAAADGVTGRWIKKDTVATSTVTVRNAGSGIAHYVNVVVDAFGQADVLLSPTAPTPPFTAFAPTVAIGAGSACVPTTERRCEIAVLAPGASVTVPVTISSLDHFGSFSITPRMAGKADNGLNGQDFCMTPACFNVGSAQITDGTSVDPHVGLVSSVRAAAGNANITFNGVVSNAGAGALTNSVFEITASSFKDGQPLLNSTAYEGDAGVSQSIQSITVPGATCLNYVDPDSGKKELDRFTCVIPSLAPNARVKYSVVAKYATAVADTTGNMSATLHTPGYALTNASSAGDFVDLNVSKTADLGVTVSSPARIGAGRIAPLTVKITNTGNTKVNSASVFVSPQIQRGGFDADDQPAACIPSAGFGAGSSLNCGVGEIAPGASRSVVVVLKAGTKLGAFPVRVTLNTLTPIGVVTDGTDTNPDNDWAVQSLTIVKANAVPLFGVKVAKAAAVKRAVLGKKGVKTTVQVPGASTVNVKLYVTPAVAKKLGLIKKAGKKSLVIGTVTKKMTKAGKVVVTVKVSKRYAAKVAKAKAKFAAKKVTTVVSTSAKTAGATSMTTQTIAVK